MTHGLKGIGQHSLVYGAGVIISRLAGMIMLPVYTRYLTPADYGTLELLQTTTEVLDVMVGLGIAGSVFRFFHDSDDPAHQRRVISTAGIALMIIAGVTAIIGMLLAPQLADLVLRNRSQAILFQLFFVIYFLQTSKLVPFLFFRAANRAWLFVGTSSAQLIVQLGLNIYFVVVKGYGVAGVLYSNILAGALIAAFVSWFTWRTTGHDFSLTIFKRMVRFGYPLAIFSLGGFFLASADRYLLNYLAGAASVGVYGVAYKFAFVLTAFAIQPFRMTWDPQRFAIARQADAKLVFARMFLYLNIGIAIVGVAIAVGVRDFLRLMADRPFWPAAQLVPVILLAYTIWAWTHYCNIGLYLKDQTRAAGWASGAAVVVSLGLNLFLIPRMGAAGAAWAAVAAFAVRFAIIYAASQKLYHIAYPWRRVTLIGVIASAAVILAQNAPVTELAYSILISASIAVGTAVLIVAFFLSASERRTILGLLRVAPRAGQKSLS